MGTEREKSVSWEKSRSVIQLCARQEGNDEERDTEELTKGEGRDGEERKKK